MNAPRDSSPPRYELARVFDDGSRTEPEVYVVAPDFVAGAVDRKRFLASGVGMTTALLLLGACATRKQELKYQVWDNEMKQWRSYTLPCGSPIPPGATCTCNCVALPVASPAPSTTTTRSCSCVPVCTCNRVCTCVPVCQAHYLLHESPVVRLIAEELLLCLGQGEAGYLRWAMSSTDDPPRRARIAEFASAIARGRRPDPVRWPSRAVLHGLLDSPDEVVRIMAAQLLTLSPREEGEDEPAPASRAALNEALRCAARRTMQIRPLFAAA